MLSKTQKLFRTEVLKDYEKGLQIILLRRETKKTLFFGLLETPTSRERTGGQEGVRIEGLQEGFQWLTEIGLKLKS